MGGLVQGAQNELMQAARYGDLIRLQLLLGHSSVNELNSDNNNALWFACFSDSKEAVKLLLENGADIDNQNVNGATALIYSASAGKTEIVKLLLEAGADTSLTTLDDFTALDLAANLKIMKMLRNNRTDD
ncbi:ankyrin repeat domain-containing protein [Amphritea pacifica]|uniref:Ankyrin repeat domain-containing protein n=1 Tax=Amphritea pacifica TaxID=2811233 RepID=A0ABS2WDE9_9GAMM|nr:ankyrin repeat domain-containing protein [Amphritea pacifica]MBN0989733.1 ankyrin repeat domain-containing protein [Amphritea pacifica]MBN1007402.1 ankyrin repeat domain-containing protein [Amphritea pacifica]